MMFDSRYWLVPLACSCAGFQAQAQESADTERLELRVVDGQPGRATLDRGRVDGLRAGDRVLLRPREGLPIEGRVLEVGERSATLEFDDPARTAQPGTRGEAWIPRERLAPANPEPPVAPVPAPAEHPAWPKADQEWKQGMPLLTEVRPLRPGERTGSVHGIWYVIADHIVDLGADRSYGLDRVGTDIGWTNPFGNGADVHFAGVANWRNAVLPDADDEHEADLRLDRLSYVVGGTRFEGERVEFGRLLQYGMPEFGLLDGIEWSAREIGGNSYGASLGYMPEPDYQQESFRDLQVAGWYRWVGDESERSALQLGYQKSFHDYTRDRDLLVARLDLVPQDGWDLHGSAWVDLYSAHDEAKGAGIELTQAFLSLGRQFTGGSSLVLTGTHIAFPQMDRQEPPPVSAAQLADDHADRLAVRARQGTGSHLWLHEEAGVWSDQDGSGGDGEAGLEIGNTVLDGDRVRISGFASRGSTSDLWGVRLTYGRQLDEGSWELGYEFDQFDFIGFTDANDQLPQHRVHVARDFHTQSGWSFSIHGEWLLYADEDSLSAGIYLQRSF
jgi:hypothetical protein